MVKGSPREPFLCGDGGNNLLSNGGYTGKWENNAHASSVCYLANHVGCFNEVSLRGI